MYKSEMYQRRALNGGRSHGRAKEEIHSTPHFPSFVMVKVKLKKMNQFTFLSFTLK